MVEEEITGKGHLLILMARLRVVMCNIPIRNRQGCFGFHMVAFCRPAECFFEAMPFPTVA